MKQKPMLQLKISAAYLSILKEQHSLYLVFTTVYIYIYIYIYIYEHDCCFSLSKLNNLKYDHYIHILLYINLRKLYLLYF